MACLFDGKLVQLTGLDHKNSSENRKLRGLLYSSGLCVHVKWTHTAFIRISFALDYAKNAHWEGGAGALSQRLCPAEPIKT